MLGTASAGEAERNERRRSLTRLRQIPYEQRRVEQRLLHGQNGS